MIHENNVTVNDWDDYFFVHDNSTYIMYIYEMLINMRPAVVRRCRIRIARRGGRMAGSQGRVTQGPSRCRGGKTGSKGTRRVVTRTARSAPERGRWPATSTADWHKHSDIVHSTGIWGSRECFFRIEFSAYTLYETYLIII